MTQTVQGVIARSKGAPVEVVDIVIPEPGPNDVVVKVQAAGVEFLDLKPSTWHNNMCAPDNKRMWAGLVDFYGGPGNLPIHVNQRGHEHVANVIARS